MRRKALTKRETIQVLLNQGAVIPCGCGCGRLITTGAEAIDEHLHQLATGGSDTDLSNRRFYRAECSNLKTNGSKATSYGSDAHARAKIKRVEKKRTADQRTGGVVPDYLARIARRKRKIPSRPFRKALKP